MSLVNRRRKNLSTEELVLLAQQDDYSALEELIKREQKNTYAAFYYMNPDKQDLSDLTQEALFRMAKNIKKLRDPKKFQSWYNRIITHLFYDEIRKKYKKPQTISLYAEKDSNSNVVNLFDIKDPKKIPAENTLAGELNNKIVSAMHDLSEPFRVPIILRELQGLSYDEIAEITQTSVGTVKSRISRARNKLQENLKSYLIQ